MAADTYALDIPIPAIQYGYFLYVWKVTTDKVFLTMPQVREALVKLNDRCGKPGQIQRQNV